MARNRIASGYRRLAAAALLVAIAAPASAFEAQSARHLPAEVMLEMVSDWVAANSDLPAPRTLPGIERVPRSRLAAIRLGGHAAKVGAGGDGIEALYDSERRVIVLPDDWRPSGPEALSVLVHEMVHHMQADAGRRFACSGEREKDAYALQGRWLEEWGSSLEHAFGVDRLTLMVRSVCTM